MVLFLITFVASSVQCRKILIGFVWTKLPVSVTISQWAQINYSFLGMVDQSNQLDQIDSIQFSQTHPRSIPLYFILALKYLTQLNENSSVLLMTVESSL